MPPKLVTDPNLIAQLEGSAPDTVKRVSPEMESLLEQSVRADQLEESRKQLQYNPKSFMGGKFKPEDIGDANPQAQGGFFDALQQSLASAGESAKQSEIKGIQTDPLGAALGYVFAPLQAAGTAIGQKTSDALKGTPLEGTPSDFLSGVASNAAQLGAMALGNKAIPAVKGAAERQLGKSFSRLPNVAEARRTAASAEANALPQLAAPQTGSDVLYKEVESLNPSVNLGPLKDKIATVLKDEQLATPGLKIPTTESVAGGLKKEFFTPQEAKTANTGVLDQYGNQITREIQPATQGKGAAPFSQVRVLMRRLNDKIGTLKSQGGEGLGDMLQLKKGFIQSLENAADGEVGAASAKLKQANMAWRNEYAMEKTADIIANATKTQEGRAADQVNTGFAQALNALNKELRKDPWLEESFPPGALERIKSGLAKLKELPLPGAPQGVDAGSKQVLSRTIKGGAAGTTIGAGLEHFMGIPGATRAGAEIGTLGGVIGAEILSNALAQPKGIALVEKMMKASPQGLTTPQLSVLQAFVRASSGINVAPPAQQPQQ